MSKPPVEISGDVNVTVASHFSKVPSSATDAFTENLTVLSSCVILKTGTCARLGNGSTADATRHRTANRMKSSMNVNMLTKLCESNQAATRWAPHSAPDTCPEKTSHS